MPFAPMGAYLGIFIFFWALIGKKLYFHEDNQFLYIQKNSKIHDKNSAHRYMPEIPFVPRRENGPLGV